LGREGLRASSSLNLSQVSDQQNGGIRRKSNTLAGRVQYIDFSKLDPLKRAALEFGFGRFFTEELPNDFAREFLTARYAAQEQSGIRIETSEEVPFRYRRFAGDATLPRGRYFSVSDSPVGDDHGP